MPRRIFSDTGAGTCGSLEPAAGGDKYDRPHRVRAIPQIHYAKRGEHHLAYTLTGSGPLELVYLLGFVSHLDLLWEDPDAARFLDRLGRFCRLVVMDKRGTGLSDRTGDVPIPEEQVDDLLTVIDSAGLERPAFLGTQDGFLVAALLAATAPERARALVGFATGAFAPEQWPVEESERFFRGLEKYWGREGRSDELLGPSEVACRSGVSALVGPLQPFGGGTDHGGAGRAQLPEIRHPPDSPSDSGANPRRHQPLEGHQPSFRSSACGGCRGREAR